MKGAPPPKWWLAVGRTADWRSARAMARVCRQTIGNMATGNLRATARARSVACCTHGAAVTLAAGKGGFQPPDVSSPRGFR